MTKNKKIFSIAAGVVGIAATGAYITTKMLIKTALDREEPEFMKFSKKHIAGGDKDTNFAKVCNVAAKKLKSSEHERVIITGKDGVKLIGHFFPAENGDRIIIAFHGWRSSWNNDYGLISEFWHNNNCHVLYVEQRGQNESEGEYIGFGLTERYDCVEWVNWAICRCGKEVPLYLAGVSMGAATVLMAADLSFGKRISGIMADCGFTSPKEIWKYVANNNLHMSYRLRSVIADEICKRKINMKSDEYSTIEALKHTDIPVLFVHGSDDKFVPVEMTYENYKACKSEKRLLIVPGADHAMSYYTDKERYEKVELEFWKDFDNRE